jgi:N-acetylglucosaminyldiphosphoundecaprenol N-acetyl-beta-D-mannosaminyltransferase
MRIHILGVPIDALTSEQALARIAGAVLAGERGYMVVTPNPEFVVAAQKDGAFLETLGQADLSIPDGQGLLWAARRRGYAVPERVTGTDMVSAVCAWAAAHGRKVYFLGGQPGVAAAAAEKLAESFPELEIQADDGGALQPDHFGNLKLPEAAWQRLQAAQPAILFVAFGQNRQERWLAENLPRLPSVNIGMGIGGAFDFIAGRAKRAPACLRRLGLEWLWRLVTEPWRWRRILRAIVVFPWLVISSRD